jgi:hypothetical protein
MIFIVLPITELMKLRKKEINLQYLALKVLELCPMDECKNFENGFIEFVQCFFLDINSCSEPFANLDGTHDVDLQAVFDLTFDTLDFLVNKQPIDERKRYWSGVMAAASISESTLRFAFEVNPINEAA